ncbi:MAG: hypothetical protein K6F33_12625 [Bacteroidales bacterium]|nr:hypothetical protein [Bacteroidales bacterium]
MALLPMASTAQRVDVELKNIRYYASTRCGNENPVLVKICFATDYPNPLDLNIIVTESNPKITYTGKVTECDGKGNIYYSFCTKDGEASNFDVYFRDANGVRSNTFSIFAKPD